MTKSDGSSKGFSLFTPLVGTTLVIMAILIATGMIQNDVRISRSITASYEVSSQSTVAKMIKAAAVIQMLSNMEESVYNQATTPFVCADAGGCVAEINARFEGTDKLRNPSIYWDLIGQKKLFLALPDSVYLILEGSGTNYRLDESSVELQNRLSSAVDLLSSPLTLRHDSAGNYYVKLDSKAFRARQGDFVIGFVDSSSNRMDVSIAPETLGITTKEPLYDLIAAAREVYLSSTMGAVSLENELDDKFKDGKEAYVNSVQFRSLFPKRLEIEFLKAGRVDQPFAVTFEDSDEEADFDLSCSYGATGFEC